MLYDKAGLRTMNSNAIMTLSSVDTIVTDILGIFTTNTPELCHLWCDGKLQVATHGEEGEEGGGEEGESQGEGLRDLSDVDDGKSTVIQRHIQVTGAMKLMMVANRNGDERAYEFPAFKKFYMMTHKKIGLAVYPDGWPKIKGRHGNGFYCWVCALPGIFFEGGTGGHGGGVPPR